MIATSSATVNFFNDMQQPYQKEQSGQQQTLRALEKPRNQWVMDKDRMSDNYY